MPATDTAPPALAVPASVGVDVPPAVGHEIHPGDLGSISESPKPGSAMSRLQERIAKQAGLEPPTPPINPAPKPKAEPKQPAKAKAQEPEKPDEKPPELDEFGDPVKPKEEPETPPEGEDDKSAKPDVSGPTKTPHPRGDGPPKKQSPWKIVDEYKAKVKDLERQVAESRTNPLSAHEKVELSKKLEQRETRLKELEDEIRFVNYQKSEEFQTKYQKPYDRAWNRAVAEIREINVTNPETGEARPATENDLYAVCNLPLGQARTLAEQMFGNFANDVLNHRKEIRSLVDAQRQALDEAKTTGATRETERQEQMKRQATEVYNTVADTFRQTHEKMLERSEIGAYLKPVEGDDELNGRLEKGFEMVDEWWPKNPMDPKLSNEERAEIVKRHVAIRNRAAGFGAMLHRLKAAEKKLTATEKELAEYKAGEPEAGGAQRKEAGTVQTGSKGWNRIVEELQKVAQ